MTEKWKACPNLMCGGSVDDVGIQRYKSSRHKKLYYVQCNKCGISSSHYEFEDDAIKDWNRRPGESAILASAEASMWWISVEERLPYDGEEVIAWQINVPHYVPNCIRTRYFANISFRLNSFGSQVTHWMPIPEPPQEAK